MAFVPITVPLISWWIISGQDRLSGGWAMLAGILGSIAMGFLLLALLALMRTQSLVGLTSDSIGSFVDIETGKTKPYSVPDAVGSLLGRWGEVSRWADVVGNHLLSAQRFLSLSAVFGLTAGLICHAGDTPPTEVEIHRIVDAVAEASPIQSAVGVAAFTVGLCLGFILLLVWGLTKLGGSYGERS